MRITTGRKRGSEGRKADVRTTREGGERGGEKGRGTKAMGGKGNLTRLSFANMKALDRVKLRLATLALWLLIMVSGGVGVGGDFSQTCTEVVQTEVK